MTTISLAPQQDFATSTQPVPEAPKPLPRSVRRLGAYRLLDGAWRFALDPEDRGLRDGWALGHDYTHMARWPGSIEGHLAAASAGASAGEAGWREAVVAWYEREFAVPRAWLADPHRLVQITFGACGYETRVWLNGHPLTTIEGEEAHVGAYTSFSYELPPDLLQATNRVTVRVAASHDAEIPRGKQESRVYQRGGIWYQTYSGPVRSVWIEPVERNRLRSRLGAIATIEEGLVEFILTTQIADPGDYRLALEVTRHDDEIVLAGKEVALPLAAGETTQRLVLALPHAETWSPEHPALYGLTARLIGPTGHAATIRAQFGLRKIEARGRRIYLNNVPTYLDGILYQPGTATYEQMRAHFTAMRDLGCNLVRVHIAGIDPRIYALADELGLLLWVEVPSPHASTERSRANHWAELQRMLPIIAAHPSVVIISLYNEDWGAQDIAESPETRAYIARTYAYLRVHYPHLLVVDNDGWNHVSTGGRLESHLLTAHVYTADQARWCELLDALMAGHTAGWTQASPVAGEPDWAIPPLVVGDPFFYEGQVPLLISEWGGFGFNTYDGANGAAPDRDERIRAFKRALRERGLAGDVYTQATHIEDERNGLIDFATGALEVPAGILNSRG
jgi:hypothetical protein